MLAIIILCFIVVIASGIGITVYRISTRFLRRLWARALVSILSGVMVFLSARAAFVYYWLNTPANDAMIFQDHKHLRVSLWGKPFGQPEGIDDAFQIEVVVPRSVRENQDFSFRLSISTKASGITLPTARAVLALPGSARSRTLDSCKNQPIPNLPEGAVAACSDRESGATPRSLTWDVTPSQAGSIRLALIIADFPSLQPWYATIEVNGSKIMRTEDGSYIGPPLQLYGSSSVGRNPKYVPFYLTPENPEAEISGFYVDLSSMQLRIPIEVKTTLGVSERAYGYMAIIGTTLAGILGTGWIWQLTGFVRSHKEKRFNLPKRTTYDLPQDQGKKKIRTIFLSAMPVRTGIE